MTRMSFLAALFAAAASAQVESTFSAGTGAPHIALRPMSTEGAANWRTATLAAAPGRNAQTFTVSYNCFLALGINGGQRYHTVLALVNSSGREISVLAEFFPLEGSSVSLVF